MTNKKRVKESVEQMATYFTKGSGEVDIVKIVNHAVGIGLALSTMTDEPFTSPKFKTMKNAAIETFLEQIKSGVKPSKSTPPEKDDVIVKLEQKLALFPKDPGIYERGLYDAYLNCLNWLKNIK